MGKANSAKAFLPLIIVFIVSTLLLVAAPSLDFLWNMDRGVMIVGNIILFAATSLSFYLFRQSLKHSRPHVFMRMIYGGMFGKMMVCLIAALIYIMTAGKNLSKGAIFGCMFLYFVYSFVEIAIILKLGRRQKYVKDRSSP